MYSVYGEYHRVASVLKRLNAVANKFAKCIYEYLRTAIEWDRMITSLLNLAFLFFYFC